MRQEGEAARPHVVITFRNGLGRFPATTPIMGNDRIPRTLQRVADWFRQSRHGIGQFNPVIPVAVAENGTVFAIDFANNRVEKWRREYLGALITAAAEAACAVLMQDHCIRIELVQQVE